MIVVTVAQHEGIEFARINAHKIDVVDQRPWRKAEIYKDIAYLAATLRLNVHREAELADERIFRRLTAANAPTEVLDANIGDFPAGRDGELVAVDDHAHCHTIDLRNLTGDSFCAYRLRPADQRRHDGAEQGSTAAAHHIASMN